MFINRTLQEDFLLYFYHLEVIFKKLVFIQFFGSRGQSLSIIVVTAIAVSYRHMGVT